MTPEIDHDRCSELLGPFVRGELDEGDARAVERHLETCPRCSAERAAVVALRPAPSDAPTDAERARLHAGVRAAIADERASGDGARPGGDVIPMQRGRRFARVAGALGVAAVALVAAIAVLTMDLDGGDDLSGAGGGTAGGGGAEAAGGGPRPQFLASGGRLPLRVLQSPLRSEAEAADGGADDADGEGRVEDDALDGAQGFRARASTLLFGDFARAYDASDARDLRAEFTEELVAQAPNARVGRQVRDCAAEVVEARDAALLPVFATADRRTLVIGFAWSEGGDELDSFMLWTWRRGSCERPSGYRAGPIGG